MLGEHTDLVFDELGCHTAVIAALRESGIILADVSRELDEQAVLGPFRVLAGPFSPKLLREWALCRKWCDSWGRAKSQILTLPTCSWNHVWVGSLVRANFGRRIV